MKKVILAALLLAALGTSQCSTLQDSVVIGAVYQVEYCEPIYDRLLEEWMWECKLRAVDDDRNNPVIIVTQPVYGRVVINRGDL